MLILLAAALHAQSSYTYILKKCYGHVNPRFLSLALLVLLSLGLGLGLVEICFI